MKYLRYIVPALIPCLALGGAWLFAYGVQTWMATDYRMAPLDGANNFAIIVGGLLCWVAAFACVYFTVQLWEKKS